MQLVRTLALAAAAVLCAGPMTAAQGDVPTTTPPASSPAPTTATPVPTTAPTTPTGAPATPTAAPDTGPTTLAPAGSSSVAATAVNQGQLTRVDVASSSTEVKVTIVNAKLTATDGSSSDMSFDPTQEQTLVVVNDKTEQLVLKQLESNVVKKLEIAAYDRDAPLVMLPTDGLQGLSELSALTFTNTKFKTSAFNLTVPKTLSYLKLNATKVDDVALSECSLKQVELAGTTFAQLPYFLFQRKYSEKININSTATITAGSTNLSDVEFDNAFSNVGKDSFLDFQDSCDATAAATRHIVCKSSALSGVRQFNKAINNNNNNNFTDAPSVTPAPTKRGESSSNTTLTVIVIVIAVVAAVLAYFVARRYFCTSKALSRSPRLNERTVGLISKDESHAANNKLSFISSDDALRQIRLEQQDISVNKSVGTGRLWVGDYSGRKVMIKRIEAESSDSYATKALITQARALAPVSHPNIVSLVGVTWVQGTDFGVVGEFMDKGTLKGVLMDLDTELDLPTKLNMCLDIAQALKYLHSSEHNMYMKRLTSRKVLVNAAMECKLNLYECHPCTNKIECPEVFGAGEMSWEAPELITRTGVLDARKINIFSLGVIIGEIMTRASPYQNTVDTVGHTLADIELVKSIKRQDRLLPHENRHEFKELPAVLRDLVDRCLSYQPLSRPTADEVVQCIESIKDYSERIGSTTSL